jgi:hypothetical protein
MQKARSQGPKPPPTACRHTVSGSLSLAVRRAFHLSLTVLLHYRSRTSIQPWRVVPPDSDRISRVPPYSGTRTHPSKTSFAYGALTRSGGPFQVTSARPPRGTGICPVRALQPRSACTPVWAIVPFRSPLLRESRFDFFSWSYLDVSVRSVGLRLPMDSGADDEA